MFSRLNVNFRKVEIIILWSRPESNWDQMFRKHLFYPLNYETKFLRTLIFYQTNSVLQINLLYPPDNYRENYETKFLVNNLS